MALNKKSTTTVPIPIDETVGQAEAHDVEEEIQSQAEARASAARRVRLAAAKVPVATILRDAIDAGAVRACDGGNEAFERGELVVSQRDHLREISCGHKYVIEAELALSSSEIGRCTEAENQAKAEKESFDATEADGAGKPGWTWFSLLRLVLYICAAAGLTYAVARVGAEFMAKNAEGQGLFDRISMLAFLPLLPLAITSFYSTLSEPGQTSIEAKRFWTGLNVVCWPFAAAFVILLAVSTSPATSSASGASGSGRWGTPAASAAPSGEGMKNVRKVIQITTDILVATVFEISAYRLIMTHSPLKTREPKGRKAARKREQNAAKIRRILEPSHVELRAAGKTTDSWIDKSCRQVEDAFTKRILFLSNISEESRRKWKEENGLFG